MYTVKEIIDTTVKEFLARGHSIACKSGKGEEWFSIDYAGKQFAIEVSEESMIPFAVRRALEAETSGWILEVLGKRWAAAPVRAVRVPGDVSIALGEGARVYLPSWIKEGGKWAEFCGRLLKAGLNAVILGEKGEGLPKQGEAAAPFLDILQKSGIRVIFKPIIVGKPEIPAGIVPWIESRFESPAYLEGKEDHTIREVLLEEIQEAKPPCIFSLPKGGWQLYDAVPEGVMLVVPREESQRLRQRLTPCYTPLGVPIGSLADFRCHKIGMIFGSLEEMSGDNSCLLFTPN